MIKILIVDDERPEIETLSRIIRDRFPSEVEVRTAENGRMGVFIASLWNPDVVLMDIEMPALNGIEASRQILETQPGTKIIFITAYSLFSYAHEAVRLGASDYILKPVNEDDVEASIRKASLQLDSIRMLEDMKEDAGRLENDEVQDKANQIICRVKKYLQHNYMNYGVSLDNVAEILNINPSYLSSLFKRTTGVNFIDYVTDIRIRNAKTLLKDPLRTAQEIADMVGYESASYFTRAFKRNTGMTPTEYRKSGFPEEA